MIFDWKNNKEEALKNGICEERIFNVSRLVMHAGNEEVTNHTFRNFSKLEFEDGTKVLNCTFENCERVAFDECEVDACTFHCIETIDFVRTNVKNSSFCDITCENDMVISLEDSKMSHCAFKDIALKNDSYLFDGTKDAWIEYCEFSQIQTSRVDREIANCEEIVGGIFKKKKRFCIIDESTCKGLSLSSEMLKILPTSYGIH